MQLRPHSPRADSTGMDIPSLASAFSGLVAARNAAAVQIAVAAKVADSQRDVGAAVVQLLQAATEGFDAAAAETVAAASLDVLA